HPVGPTRVAPAWPAKGRTRFSSHAPFPTSLNPSYTTLHVCIVGTASALGHDPADVLGRILYVAGLAVDAVGRIDLQARLAAFGHDFVDARRAIAGLGRVV